MVTAVQAHRHAVTASLSQAAAELQAVLSGPVTAYPAGVKDGKTVTRWSNNTAGSARPESEERLRTAYAILSLLRGTDAPSTIRARFIGLNPYLGDVSPVEAIRHGRSQEVFAAARAFIAHG